MITYLPTARTDDKMNTRCGDNTKEKKRQFGFKFMGLWGCRVTLDSECLEEIKK